MAVPALRFPQDPSSCPNSQESSLDVRTCLRLPLHAQEWKRKMKGFLEVPDDSLKNVKDGRSKPMVQELSDCSQISSGQAWQGVLSRRAVRASSEPTRRLSRTCRTCVEPTRRSSSVSTHPSRISSKVSMLPVSLLHVLQAPLIAIYSATRKRKKVNTAPTRVEAYSYACRNSEPCTRQSAEFQSVIPQESVASTSSKDAGVFKTYGHRRSLTSSRRCVKGLKELEEKIQLKTHETPTTFQSYKFAMWDA